jgi:phage terminase small subunit
VSKRLPEKRRRFIEAYLGEAKGNATEAARIAGYGSPAVEGCRLLKNAQVQAELEKRVSEDPAVKSREEILRWWSDMMDAGGVEPRDRIKASELLAKAHGMFVQKVEHSGPGGSPIEVSAEQADGVRRLLSDETARERLIDALGVLSAGAGSGTA